MTHPSQESEMPTPRTYRTEGGGIEVIVDVPESASWVEDQFPDEVAFLREQAATEVRRELLAATPAPDSGAEERLRLVKVARARVERIVARYEGQEAALWAGWALADLDAVLATPAPDTGAEAPEGWRWACASCHRPVPTMGMCQTCGVFGVMETERRVKDDPLVPQWEERRGR